MPQFPRLPVMPFSTPPVAQTTPELTTVVAPRWLAPAICGEGQFVVPPSGYVEMIGVRDNAKNPDPARRSAIVYSRPFQADGKDYKPYMGDPTGVTCDDFGMCVDRAGQVILQARPGTCYDESLWARFTGSIVQKNFGLVREPLVKLPSENPQVSGNPGPLPAAVPEKK